MQLEIKDSLGPKCRFLWARSPLRWIERQWKHVLSSSKSTFQLIFGKNRHRILHAKDKNYHPDCYQQKVQKPASVMVRGWISAHGMGDLHIYDGTIDAEAYVGILERHMLPSRQLFLETPCLFQQDNARPHSTWVTTAWLHRHRVCLLDWPDWPACNLSPIENVLRIMKRRIRQWWPQPVVQLKLYTRRMGKNSTCKTAMIDIFSSQTITKCN